MNLNIRPKKTVKLGDQLHEQILDWIISGTPLRREGNAEEVADLVACLAGDESSFLTGNNVDINGGLAFS
jgi:3-oxoacyl-[acyl-carrier protein] reductase